MKTDKESIIAALKLWFHEGDVFEIRVLDATTSEWMRPHMESGYFDYKHIPDTAEAISKLRSFRGAYATVNPVNPDLLARACNRLRGITREPTTADTDIIARRWLLIDCDPKRVRRVEFGFRTRGGHFNGLQDQVRAGRFRLAGADHARLR